MGMRFLPDILNRKLGICSQLLRGNIFNRFARRKYCLKKQLLKYNELCDEINDVVDELKREALNRHIITHIIDVEGPKYTLVERYEDYDERQIVEMLENEGFLEYFGDIMGAIRRNKLEKKCEKLIKKLDKIKGKYIKKYSLTEEELQNW